MQLQGIAQLGLLANTQLLTAQQQQPQQPQQQTSMPSAQDMISKILQMTSQPHHNVPDINLQPAPQMLKSDSSQIHTSVDQQRETLNSYPPSLFPLSREGSMRHSNRRVQRHKSIGAVDKFDGYGAENPPNESVLINAMLNTQQARVLAESRK